MSETSRKNVHQLAYFQNSADLLAIFWLFHKEYTKGYDLSEPFPYDYTPNFSNSSAYPMGDPVIANKPIIERYSVDSAKRHINSFDTFRAFLQEDIFYFPDDLRRFRHPYVQMLYNKSVNSFTKGSLISLGTEGDHLSDFFGGAIRNANRVITQLVALFGKDFNPQDPVLLSRIHLKNVSRMRSMIGIPLVPNSPDESDLDFSLVHPTERLDRTILRELGRGVAIGCPTSLPVSDETRAFIYQVIGKEVKKEVMLKRYARDLAKDFSKQVLEPFRLCSPEEVDKRYYPHTKALFSGEIWETVQRSQKSL